MERPEWVTAEEIGNLCDGMMGLARQMVQAGEEDRRRVLAGEHGEEVKQALLAYEASPEYKFWENAKIK